MLVLLFLAGCGDSSLETPAPLTLEVSERVEALDVTLRGPAGQSSQRFELGDQLSITLHPEPGLYDIEVTPVEDGVARGKTRVERDLRVGPAMVYVLCQRPQKESPAPPEPEVPQPRVLRPNIVLIVLDDLDYFDVGANGSDSTRTPRIDQLATEGVRFSQFYSNGCVCSPTRASILTSRSPMAYGWRTVVGGQKGLPTQIPTVADVLTARGYATGHIGKWHVGGVRPLPQGFGLERTWVRDSLNPSEEIINADSFYWGYRLLSGAIAQVMPRLGQAGADDQYASKLFTDEAIEFVTAHQNEPFFLNLWHLSPHAPFHVPAKWDNTAYGYDLSSPEGKVSAMVTDVDREIGRLVDHIDSLGLASKTVVIVTSDNGGTRLGRSAVTRRRGNLRGFKSELYEGGIRVPFIARWPGSIVAGSVDNRSIGSTADLLPTFAQMAQAPAPAGIVGRSLYPTLTRTGKSTHGPDLFWVADRVDSWTEAVEQGIPPDELDQFAVRSGPYKLVRGPRSKRTELYDLSSGFQSEFSDLAAQRPSVVTDLTARYKAWKRTVGNVAYEPTLEGGVLTVPYDRRIDPTDGDWTFSMEVRADESGRNAVLATRPGCWELRWNSSERVVLKLYDDRPDLPLEAREVRLQSPPLTVGVPHRIDWTVYSFTSGNRLVSLYVDGVLVQRLLPDAYPAGKSLYALPQSKGPIYLGSLPDGKGAFRGAFALPRVSAACLLGDEL